MEHEELPACQYFLAFGTFFLQFYNCSIKKLRAMKLLKLLFITFFASLILQYCTPPEQPEDPTVCTEQFVMISLTVTESDGSPADSVQISVSSEVNDKEYSCDDYLCSEKETGTYVIMHDGLLEKLSDEETVTVEGTKKGQQFREEFVFQQGECHVKKVAGPDTVTLSSDS